MSSTERARRWREQNPERWTEHQRRYRKQQRKPCRGCGGPMPFPSPGAKYCSEECRADARLGQARAWRARAQARLSAYKVGLGCNRCGYRQSASALHFHHRDPKQKELRLSARQFVAMRVATKAELAKCDLLCANCHFEAHDELRGFELALPPQE